MSDTALFAFCTAIADGDETDVLLQLGKTPQLAQAVARAGATRADASRWFLPAIRHYLYAGDTALHVAAAAHRPHLVRALLEAGAAPAARNRHGATPLHVASDGAPGDARWDPAAQAEVIALLAATGVDPNTADGKGVTPLHRAVRTRSAAAVRALLAAGADRGRRSAAGSRPVDLTRTNTGRSGSGHPAAKANLAEIVILLGA